MGLGGSVHAAVYKHVLCPIFSIGLLTIDVIVKADSFVKNAGGVFSR